MLNKKLESSKLNYKKLCKKYDDIASKKDHNKNLLHKIRIEKYKAFEQMHALIQSVKTGRYVKPLTLQESFDEAIKG